MNVSDFLCRPHILLFDKHKKREIRKYLFIIMIGENTENVGVEKL